MLPHTLCRMYRAALLLALVQPMVGAVAQTKRALLIGIDSYNHGAVAHPVSVTRQDGTRFDLDTFPDLEGSVNDARSMQEMLTGKFGFPVANTRLLITPAETTDAAILSAMIRYLVDEPKPGDTVVFYYAGHGSQRRNSLTDKDDHLDNTLVGSDANTGAFDVRDRQIAAVLNRAADKGIHVTAIYDSCHSGTIARGIPPGSAGRVRFLGYDPRDIAEAPSALTPPEDRAVNPVLVFSATGPDQLANEWKGSDRTHGAFTTALLDALRELPPDTAARDIYQRVAVIMQGMALNSEQQPFLSRNVRAAEPLFGGVANKRQRIAVTAVQAGVIGLDSGYLNNIGKASVLSRVHNPAKPDVQIRVTAVDGPGHSTAKVISSSPATVETGDLFELTSWVPIETHALKLWLPPVISAAQQSAALAAIETLRASSQIQWVADPMQQTPQFRLAWDGSAWLLHNRKSAVPVSLGAHLEASAALSHLPTAATLMVEVPPAEAAIASLRPRSEETFVLAQTPEDAAYILIGTVSHDGLRYALVRKDVITLGVTVDPATNATGQAMCSNNSAYPIRTDWQAADAAGVAALHQSTLALAKIHSWLGLPIPPDTGEPFPYHLRLADATGKLFATDEVPRNRDLHFVLTADGPVSLSLPPRTIYILDIDCQGAGVLLLGRSSDKKIPAPGTNDAVVSFDRPTINFRDPPFGRETFILLSTTEPLGNPAVLDFTAVLTGTVTRSADVPVTPLQQLLGDASHATRSADPAVPPDWSVDYLQVHAIP